MKWKDCPQIAREEVIAYVLRATEMEIPPRLDNTPLLLEHYRCALLAYAAAVELLVEAGKDE